MENDKSTGYSPRPIPPRNQIVYDDFLELPTDIRKYRIVKRRTEKIESTGAGNSLFPSRSYRTHIFTYTYHVQIKMWRFLYYKWYDIGPVSCDSIDEAKTWIEKTVEEQKEFVPDVVVWSGTNPILVKV